MTTTKTSIRITTVADTLHTKDEIIEAANENLSAYFLRSGAKASALHPRYGDLLHGMQRLIAAGGKRLRPYMAVISYEAYGGNRFSDIVQVGTALELLHNALLIHDDVIDRDSVRHGIDNITGQYERTFHDSKDAHHYANSMAILAGDISLSAAYQLVLESDLSAGQKVAVQTLLADAIFHVAGGELLDTDAVLYDTALTDPLDVAAIKTAHYSFVTPLLCGAVLAGADEHELSKLTDFGMELGVAFQLSDDLLGIFGDEELTGKSSLGDIREGKRTWLAKTARAKANKQQLAIFNKYYGNPDVTERQAVTVRNIIVDCGAKKASEKLMSSYTRKARDFIPTLTISAESRQAFTELVSQVTKRSQ